MPKGVTVEKESHEYELIAVSPLRKLEKRMEELESTKGMDVREFYRELVDIIKMNQQIVDELAKANDALRIELSRLPSKIEDLVSRLDELISFIKASATEEVSPAADMKPVAGKLDQLIESNKKVSETNQAVLSLLDEISRKLSRPAPPLLRKPVLLPQRPI